MCGQNSRTIAGGHAMVCWMKLDVAKGCSVKVKEMQGEQATRMGVQVQLLACVEACMEGSCYW